MTISEYHSTKHNLKIIYHMYLIKVHSKMCDTTNVDILYVHDFASWAPKNTSISSALKHSKVMTIQYLHARFQNHVLCATWFLICIWNLLVLFSWHVFCMKCVFAWLQNIYLLLLFVRNMYDFASLRPAKHVL